MSGCRLRRRAEACRGGVSDVRSVVLCCVRAALVRRERSAFRISSRSTMSALPFLAAQCSGDHPSCGRRTRARKED